MDDLAARLRAADPGELAELVRKRRDRITFDFRGTDAVPHTPLNATRAVTVSAVFYVLRTLLPAFTPTNDGILRAVDIRTEPGTLVDVQPFNGVV